MAKPGRRKGPAPRRPERARPTPHPSAPAAVPAPVPAPRNALGTSSLVVGLVAVVASPALAPGVVLGLVAIATGFLGRRRVRRGEATNPRRALAGVLLGMAALLVVTGLIVYGQVLLSTPEGERYTACLDAAGDDAARQACQERYDEERGR